MLKRKFLAALCAVALAGCGALAQDSNAPIEPQPTPDAELQSDPNLQPTTSALLNGCYYDATRTPLNAGVLAPDFSLPLAADLQPKKSGDEKIVVREIQLSNFVAASTPSTPPTKNTKIRKPQNPIVLIFWAFWCDTWKDATRDLKKLRPQLEAEHARVLCVAVDASQQPVARRAFQSKDIWFPVVIDDVSTHMSTPAASPNQNEPQNAGEKFGVRRVPTVFVLDSSRLIRARFEGFPKTRALMDAIRDAKKPPAKTK